MATINDNDGATSARSSESGSRSVATIERAVDVLLLFARPEVTDLGVTEISKELDISKAVVHRILTSLKDRGFVSTEGGSRRYSLGSAVLHLAAAYRDRLDVRVLALEVMTALSAATDETATLSIRTGNTRIYVDQVTPAREVKMAVQIGQAFPLHAGSSSKAFLAFLPEDEREEYLRSSDLASITANTITNADVLRRELDQVRKQGFAVSMGERQADAASVAAPIFDTEGPIAVISVCGPIERFRSSVAETAAAVVDATRELSARMGHQDD